MSPLGALAVALAVLLAAALAALWRTAARLTDALGYARRLETVAHDAATDTVVHLANLRAARAQLADAREMASRAVSSRDETQELLDLLTERLAENIGGARPDVSTDTTTEAEAPAA